MSSTVGTFQKEAFAVHSSSSHLVANTISHTVRDYVVDRRRKGMPGVVFQRLNQPSDVKILLMPTLLRHGFARVDVNDIDVVSRVNGSPVVVTYNYSKDLQGYSTPIPSSVIPTGTDCVRIQLRNWNSSINTATGVSAFVVCLESPQCDGRILRVHVDTRQCTFEFGIGAMWLLCGTEPVSGSAFTLTNWFPTELTQDYFFEFRSLAVSGGYVWTPTQRSHSFTGAIVQP